MDWVGISQVLCPFPCDVLAMYQPGKLALVPSVKNGPAGVEEYVRSGMIYYKEIPFLYHVFKPTTVQTKSKKEEGGYVVVSAIHLLSIPFEQTM